VILWKRGGFLCSFSRPPFLPVWALHPPIIKKPPPFCAAGGGFVLVPGFEHDYAVDNVYYRESLDGIAGVAPIFPLIHYGFAVVEMHENTAVFAETVEALAKAVDCLRCFSPFLETADVELLV
jgi:hypothetical protein